LPIVGVSRVQLQVVPNLPPRTPAGAASYLLTLAQATRSPLTDWSDGSSWSRASNAHRTNTPVELDVALRSSHNWLEGDVRVDDTGTRLVMAHERGDIPAGLAFDDWLRACAASGRGVKVELKEPAGFELLVAALALGLVPQDRLIVNVTVAGPRGKVLTDDQLRRLRALVPGATINLSPTDQQRLGPAVLAELARTADLVGGKVMFPLQWDLVTDEVIRALKPHGRIAIWVAVPWGTPGDVDEETVALRLRGVDGMVDLPRNVGTGMKLVSLGARALGTLFGRQAVVDARAGVLRLLRRG
jgi:hypothetical protein